LLCVTAGLAQHSNPANEESAAAGVGSVPRLVRFSGTLRDAGARPLRGPVDVTFSLYAIEAGGEPLWFETQTVEADALGRYTVLLGAMHVDGLPMDLFASGEARWLGVSVGKLSESAEGGRVLLVSVPYALKAGDAETVGGKPATAFVASDQLQDQVRSELSSQVSSGKVGGKTLTALISGTSMPVPQALSEGPSSFVCNLASDCVAVTQSGSGVGLHVTAPTGSSVLGELSGTSGAAVFGRATAGTGAAIGVWGDSASAGGVGVLGRAAAATGVAKGVLGRSFSTSGIGVHGDAPAASGTTRGVWGSTGSTGGIGVWGHASAPTGTTTGVQGTVASTSGVAVFAQAGAASGATTGVLAKVLSATGTALVANNTAGGKIFSGQNNGDEKFSVSGTGNVRATAYQDPNGNPIPLTSLPSTVSVRGINYLAGCDNCSALTDADDQRAFYVNVIGAMTIASVTCYSDAGTPSINLQRDDGTPANILTSNLSCSSGGASGTIDTNEGNLALGEKLDFAIISAGGVAKRVTVVIKTVLN
jgi:hypothetical protein